MTELMPRTVALIDQVKAAVPKQHTPEFDRIDERLYTAQACTSLGDDAATVRMNDLPPGATREWVLIAEGDNAPVPCDDKATHRHLLFECRNR